MHGDDGAFRKWMQFEMGSVHSGLVIQRRPLADVLREAKPTAVARGGTHEFDVKTLQRFGAALDLELRYTVRVPLHVYVDSEVGDAVYVQDPPSAEALTALGFVLTQPDAVGRAWMGRALALQALRDWPTVVQLVYL